MIFLSPGVKTREVDFSTYVGQISSCIVGIVGGGSKGPIGVPTLCTSPSDFVDQFGEPLATDFGALAALEFLKQGNQLYYVRMAEESVAYAEAALSNNLIIVRAKEKGTYYHRISAAIAKVEGDVITLNIYKDGLIEETISGSIDPTSENFIETVSSYWVDVIYNDESEIQPEILSFIGEDFVNNSDNKWELIKDKDAAELTTLEFNTNIQVSVAQLVVVSDSTGNLTVGSFIGNTTVSGTHFTSVLPTGTLDFSETADWVKEFKITLTSANGLSSEEFIKISSVAVGVTTIVTPGAATAGPSTSTVSEASLTIDESPVALTNGNDGCPLTWQTVIGAGTTGLQAFRNVDEYDVNLIAAPGFYQAAVANELLEIAEQRADCLAILDTPAGLSRQDVIAYHNGTLDGEDMPQKALNSSYGAIYYPWVQLYDTYSAEYRWAPPSGVVLGAMAYNDNVGQPWFAPAGLNRGMLNSVIAVERSLDEGSRDALYGNGNVINSILNYKKQGITIWGQRTLQRKNSATDRVNVRRLMNTIRKAIAASTAYIVFEQNDPLTWRQWVGTIEPYLESIKSSRGFYDYKVIMDETTVTDYYKDRNEMPGKVFIKPTKTAEFIPIDFILTSSGASFTE